MSEAAFPPIVHFQSAQPETTRSKPPADRLLKGDPEQIVRNFYGDASGQFFAGVWESTPGRWRVRYTEHEFCHITRGKVRIDDPSGRSWSFGAGDSFVIPAGFSGVWEVLEPTSKLYAIFEAASK